MRIFTIPSVVLCIALAACGGGGSSSGGGGVNPNPGGNNPGGGGGTPASTPQKAQVAGSIGFVTSGGMTLYLFEADTTNKSNCSSANGCTGVWPPYTAPAGTVAPAGFTLITRSDGTLQWAFNGWPLYGYVGDKAAGDNKGNGLTEFGGLWQTARPSAQGAGTGGGGNGTGGSGGGNPYP